MNPEWLDVRADGTVSRSGIITPTGTKIVKKVGPRWNEEDHGFLVVKIPGGTSWSGRGQQSYYPAEFVVYAILEDLTDVRDVGVIRADRLFDFPVRS